ncbi:MAG: AsnC family transcriptional regulator [Chloroflexota bacterium]
MSTNVLPLDTIDRKLLNLMQTEFPLTDTPYAALGQKLGTDAGEVMRRIVGLKNREIIRLVGPVMDARSLGYRSTLVVMKITESRLNKAEAVIARHTGVSHGYERGHNYNVWFTLALPPEADVETEVAKLSSATGAEAAFSLPAVRLFKIGAYFDMGDNGHNTSVTQPGHALSRKVELSATDCLIINEVQQDLPLVDTPFRAMAERVDMDVEQFLAGCRSLQQRGVIRRFSACINHNHAGFTANALSAWKTSPETIDIAGQKLASLREVSHCYERKTNSLWPYHLLAMIHGHSRDVCQEIAAGVSHETGISDYRLLYSTKEFKKTRVKYQV